MSTDPTALAGERTLLGWPVVTTCRCGGRAVHLHSSDATASYECRGTPPADSRSAYGPDRCGTVFHLTR